MKYNSYANPFMSRKVYRYVCEWWSRSTFDGQLPLFKMALTTAPTGKFHAKEVSQFYFGKKNEGDIRLSDGSVTIETPDDVSFVRPDDIVKFEGVLYRVISIGRRDVAKTRENMKNPISVYVLSLTR